MRKADKTQERLIDELTELRRRVAELEESEARLKQVEAQLRKSEERYKSLVELATDGTLTMDRKGIVTFINSAFMELTQFGKDEIVGKHFSKLGTLRARDIPRYAGIVANTMRGKPSKPFEFTFLRKDGTTGIGEACLAPLKENGKTVGMQSVLRDITQRKQMEEELLKVEKLESITI